MEQNSLMSSPLMSSPLMSSPLHRRRLTRQASASHPTSPLRIFFFCSFILFSATFLILLTFCWDQPVCLLNTMFSKKEEVSHLILENESNAEEAQTYLERLWLRKEGSVLDEFQRRLESIRNSGREGQLSQEASHRRLLFAIVTVDRPRNPRYLTQVVASLAKQLADDQESFVRKSRLRGRKVASLGDIETSAFIFAADCVDGDLSSRSELQFVSKFIPVLTRDSVMEKLSDGHQCKWMDPRWTLDYCRRVVQENEDYILLLQKALLFNPDFIVAIEDDAVAMPWLIPKMHRLLQAKQLRPLPNGTIPWSFVKLSYPLKWTGFEKYSLHWIFATVLIISAGIVGMLPNILKWRRSQWERQKWLIYKCQVVLCILGAIYIMILLDVFGRQSIMGWLEPYPLVHRVVPAKGCCTQAQLYSQQSATDYVSRFKEQQQAIASVDTPFSQQIPILPIDLWLDSEETLYGKWMVEPNMFRHIGTISSLGKGDRLTD